MDIYDLITLKNKAAILGEVLGQVPDNSLTDAKLISTGIKATVSSHTSQLAEKAQQSDVRLKATLINATTDFDAATKTMMTGTTPITYSPIPTPLSLLNSMIAPLTITPDKTNFLVQSVNLFNYNDATNLIGYYCDENAGNSLANAAYGVSHKIPVTVGTTYTLSTVHCNYNGYGAYYDINNTFISPLSATPDLAVVTSTAPTNAVYMKVTYYLADNTITMLVVGSTLPSIYVSYNFTAASNIFMGVGSINNAAIYDDVYPHFGVSKNLPLTKDIIIVKQGVNISVRIPNWDAINDFYTLWQNPYVDNKGLGLSSMNTCLSTTPLNIISGTSWKPSNDDITPLHLNGSYMGADHGYPIIDQITMSAHGKTTVDIGSLWSMSSVNYIIVSIVDANTLITISDYTGNQTAPATQLPTSSGTLVHVSGATNTANIMYTSKTGVQLYPSTNNNSVKYVVDGKEISTDGIYFGNKFNIVESYNITDIPSIQAYLKSHVGSSVAPNVADNSIAGSVNVTNIYAHDKCGGITVYTSYNYLKSTTVDFYGVVQSDGIGKKAYVPNVGMVGTYNMSTVVTQGASDILTFSSNTWLNANVPPYRYHQFSTDQTKGMAIGYNPAYGIANPLISKNITSAGYFNTVSNKMYPFIKTTESVVAGNYEEAVAFRVPLRVIDADATCLYWYWVGNDIYLAFDYHKNINKYIVLPSYLVGKKIQNLDVHANTTIQSTLVTAQGIKVAIINNYGYGVVRLYD